MTINGQKQTAEDILRIAGIPAEKIRERLRDTETGIGETQPMSKPTLWIVGQAFACGECSRDGNHRCWEFAGIFDSEEKAVEACREINYFIAPHTLNERLPHESADMPGAYYPLERAAQP